MHERATEQMPEYGITIQVRKGVSNTCMYGKANENRVVVISKYYNYTNRQSINICTFCSGATIEQILHRDIYRIQLIEQARKAL
jgi:hypothetical protein